MRLTAHFFLFSLVLLLLASCDNELDLIEERVETPIVYGILDAKDTATYIRVEQSFIDPEVNALTLAQDAENLYFDDIEVMLTNESTGVSVTLDQVDGNEDGYPREDGVFAQSPNILYKTTQQVFPFAVGDDISVQVVRAEQSIASSTIMLVDSVSLRRPNAGRPNVGFNAADPAGIEIAFDADENSELFDIVFRLFIAEGSSQRIIEIEAATNTSDSDFRMPLNEFYSKVATALRQLPLSSRQFTGAQIIVTSAGPELAEYIEVGQANLGITSSQEVPVYTNINGGLGVFSSRSKIVTRVLEPTSATLDSLANGQFTQGLGFE